MMGFGHSILAMSGEESLAQVYREIEHPKVKNLKRTGLVIVIYSLLFTSLVSFFATAIIPDAQRPKFYDLITADGVPYEKIARLHGANVLATTVVVICLSGSMFTRPVHGVAHMVLTFCIQPIAWSAMSAER